MLLPKGRVFCQYSVDMSTHCLIMLKTILFCHNMELSYLKQHVNLSI